MNLKESKTNSIAGVEKIEIESVAEQISLIKTTDADLKADLRGYSNRDVALSMTMSADNKTLTVKVQHSQKFGWFCNFGGGQLDVYIPESYTSDLAIKSISGSIDATDISKINNLRAESTSGRINLDAKSGEAENLFVKTVSGKVEAQNLRGLKSVEARSTSGHLELSGLAGKVDATTISGRIELGVVELKDDIKAKSTSGRVEIDLPEAADADFTFETVSGGLRDKDKLSLSRDTRSFYEGKIGNGGVKIEVETVSGGLSIE